MNAIGWRNEFIEPLRDSSLVFITLRNIRIYSQIHLSLGVALSKNETFDLNGCVQEGFFVENIRELIEFYVEFFCRHISFTPTTLTNVQQNALYQAKQIHATYTSNLKYRFRQHLWHLVNLLLDVKNQRNNLKVRLQNEGLSHMKYQQDGAKNL
ncbi:uncharacterized protein BYT42DRAFT_645586 [Radiomyces spectabilis]|uniref:uncharacterized protein n=1 Tax=Radiomyces spectabilis TaxID=64574 RepID=UPI00221EEFA2|nr:uncharacterized protein BYT42DRAFT_645586 [Radiomyces spectabilis]KAI8378072.1 hypothetical protein BYT42DRAFT_645586 [Radiomyces spectabilis]